MTCSAIVEKQDLLTAPTEELVFITVHTLKMLVSDVYVSCKSLAKKLKSIGPHYCNFAALFSHFSLIRVRVRVWVWETSLYTDEQSNA